MATLSAALQCLHITSPQPARMAEFYAATYDMTAEEQGGVWCCRGPEREVAISLGPVNKLRYALFRFESTESWTAFQQRAAALDTVDPPADCRLAADTLAVRDPDGNLIAFEGPTAASAADWEEGGVAGEAALQHFAFRTQQIDRMLAFYENDLGFVLSDKVVDAQGGLRACFLRVNALHHAMALFNAPVTCYDHQSFEAPDWSHLQKWADRMGSLRTTIVWGVGRHGPGNDVFFMVRDPDGNLAEISSEIETCADDRPAGQWPHEERTLNLWGQAIMRS